MPSPSPAPATAGATRRVALARLALDAALAVPDVVAGDAGMHGLRVTADPRAGLLRGVSVTAERDGRYAVDLRLVARLAPLVALGEAVRRRVQDSARRQGFADQLGGVNVEFARIAEPGDVEPAPAPVVAGIADVPALPPAGPVDRLDGQVLG